MPEPWVNPNGSTNVDGWLAAYAADDNNFWRTEPGHIMNVVDALIERDQGHRDDLRDPAPTTTYETYEETDITRRPRYRIVVDGPTVHLVGWAVGARVARDIGALMSVINADITISPEPAEPPDYD